MSIALEVGRLAEERLGAAGVPQLITVAMEVGDDAGVEIGSLEFCLEAVLATPPFRGARPAIARCGGDVLRVAYFEIDDGRPDN